MAYQVENDSIVQVIMRGRQGAQECMNVMHFRPVDAPAGDIADGLANLQEIVDILDQVPGGWSELLGEVTQEDFTLDWVQAQYVWPARFSYYRKAPASPGGTLVGDAAPPNVQASITFQGDGVGRHQRGAMRIPALRAADVTEGLLDSTLVANLNLLADFLVEPFSVTGAILDYEAVIFQRSAPAASVPITHFTTQTTSRVVRRRTVGLGT